MKNNNTTPNRQTTETKKKKKSSWLTTNYAISGYGLLIRTLSIVLVCILVGLCAGVGLTHTNYAVKDTEGRGYIYTVEGVVVATDNALCTIEDTEGTLWLVDNKALTRGDTLLLYVVDNKTDTQRDDEIVRVWIDTAQ